MLTAVQVVSNAILESCSVGQYSSVYSRTLFKSCEDKEPPVVIQKQGAEKQFFSKEM